jgi:hypothetical protein
MNDFEDADEKKIADQKKEQDFLRRRRNDDLQWCLSTAKGRRFILDVLSDCGAYRRSYVAKDFGETAFNEGRRDIGLYLIQRINEFNPSVSLQLHNEWLGEQLKNRKKGETQ